MIVHQLLVCAGVVPGVEGVVADDGQGLVGESGLVLHDVVEVLVVTPGKHDLVQTTAGAVNSELSAIDVVAVVRVLLEGLGAVDDAVIESETDGEGVADDVPLALCVEEVEQLAQVVDETGELHPAGLAIAADGLGGLEKVLDLGEAGVGVGLVNEGVELLHGLPDGHLGAGLGVKGVAGLQVVSNSLLGVLLLVEVLDTVAGVLVLTELGLVLVLVEFRFGVDILVVLLNVLLEDVDGVDGIGGFLEGLSITLGVEHRGLWGDSNWGHCE